MNSAQLCVLRDEETADGQVYGRAGENVAQEEDPLFQSLSKVCSGSGFRERQRVREREREKERERDGYVDRQTEKERERNRKRKRNKGERRLIRKCVTLRKSEENLVG